MNIHTISLLVLLGIAAFASAQENISRIPQRVGLDQHLNAQLPLDLKLRNEQGEIVALGDYFRDKPVIVNFVYFRCPMLCTQVLNGLLKTSQSLKLRLGDDYEIVSISIDPRETPKMATEKKRRYVSQYRRAGAEQGWHFLTGDADSVTELTQVAGFRYHYDEASDQYAHASGIIVATPSGRVSRYLYGIDYHPTDLRLALVESSENRIGSPVDQFLLLCYHYDPATGKYGLVISRVIQFFGSLTAIALGTFLWINFRRERERSRTLAKQHHPTPL